MKNDKIAQIFSNLEQNRIQSLNECYRAILKFLLISFTLIILVVVFTIKTNLNEYIDLIATTYSMLAGIIATFLGYLILKLNNIKNSYINKYKEIIISNLLKTHQNSNYDPRAEDFDMTILDNFEIVTKFREYKKEDYIIFRNDGIKLEHCELSLMSNNWAIGLSYSSKDKKIITEHKSNFKGSAILITTPFKFDNHIIIRKNRISLLNALISILSFKKRVRLEDSSFENLFEIYAHNQTDTRYILSPTMMNRFMELHNIIAKNSKGAYFTCEIKENKMLILIRHKKNWLEPTSLFISAFKTEKIKETKEEINILSNIISQLKIDYLKDRKLAIKNLKK